MMKELLAGYANGQQLKDQAEQRYIAYSTAANTIAEAKKRLDAENLAHAVVQAMGKGFLSFPTGPDHTVVVL